MRLVLFTTFWIKVILWLVFAFVFGSFVELLTLLFCELFVILWGTCDPPFSWNIRTNHMRFNLLVLWTKPDLWSGDVMCGVSLRCRNAALRKVELQLECHWDDWLQLIWGRSKFSLYGFVLSHQFWSDILTWQQVFFSLCFTQCETFFSH